MFQQQPDGESNIRLSCKKAESSRKQRCFQLEQIIEKGLKAFYEVGKALTEIQKEKLYKERGYSNFRTYCEQRWGIKKSHAYRIIQATEAFDNIVSPIGDTFTGKQLPTNEAQLRPLTRLNAFQQKQVWQQAVATAPQGKITADHVRKVAKQVSNSQSPKSEVSNPPSFTESQPGDCVQIHLRNRNDSELNSYDGQLAIVEEVKEYSVSVWIWGKLLPPLFPDEVKPAPATVRVTAEIKTELVAKIMKSGKYDSIEAAIADLLENKLF